MHDLRFLETAKRAIAGNFEYILSELLIELSVDVAKEDLSFPSDELLDALHLYERTDRNAVERILKNYAEEIRSLWCEYSLGSLMKPTLYPNCRTTGHGDFLLCKAVQVTG